MGSIQPASEPSRQDVIDLLATIRRHAFDVGRAPAESLIVIRDAIREYDGEFDDSDE
jgi:hypothetical protein